MQVQVRKPVERNRIRPHWYAGGYIDCARHRAVMPGKDAAIVRYANIGRYILEKDHDTGIMRQEIAIGPRLAFSLPVDTDQPVQHAPLNRRNHPDAFGLPDHRMPEAQNVPIRM